VELINHDNISKEMMTLSNAEAEWKLVWEENFNLSEIEESRKFSDDTTHFPQRMTVDYIKVYEREAK
jgi:hypothetical protein